MSDLRRQIFDAWIPQESAWSPWAKPVVFATMDLPSEEEIARHRLGSIPPWLWLPQRLEPAAWVLDVPGTMSVVGAAVMATRGYRPVPLFNGSPQPAHMRAAVDVRQAAMQLALLSGVVGGSPIAPNAPPVFMLDSDRLPARSPSPGMFDNRWMTFAQDFPSAGVLKRYAIGGVVVVMGDEELVSEDLQHVLRRWQEGGLPIRRVRVNESSPSDYEVVPPRRFRSIFYRAMAKADLRPNAAGGFGALVPEPQEHSGHGFRGGGFG